ncbi:hypothetical protein CFN78_03710 [Amycolatopsis antarctica]|uniref:ESX-1 secretion-associated protein n=1 Tax=Amycolatopsis antarctica TaxID=1854586 RepID=A0A263D7A7_9PSEU|nr:hypothetical protein [Amycolatopsis antarctica]OZM74261.1 hypothetical protein CFN78_03710 [Amycolatopsis antarctica]
MTGPSGGNLHMDTAATERAMAALAAAGEDLRTGWETSLSAITSLDGQLGQGPLGQNFLGDYGPAATAIRQAANQCVSGPGRIAAAGQAGIADYAQADTDGAAGFHTRNRAE